MVSEDKLPCLRQLSDGNGSCIGYFFSSSVKTTCVTVPTTGGERLPK